MRVLFAGTPEIAVPALAKVAASHQVCAVLTNPPREAGRSRRTKAPPVQEAAEAARLPVLQPARLGAEARARVAELRPDVLAVVAYGRIFGPRFLALFPRGGVNLHPSLLPLHRGPSPIQAALLAGDAETGVTIQRLAAEVDAGDVLAQARVAVGEHETAVELGARLAELGAALLVDVLDGMAAGEVEGRPQDSVLATFSRLIEKGDGLARWSDSARAIYNRYRAFQPWPGLFTTYRGQQLEIRRCRPAEDARDEAAAEACPPGRVVSMDRGGGLLVQTGEGLLRVTELQLQQKKAMDAKSFVNGHRDILGAVLGGE
jgi:methionyl-tRNA formyltransferase